MDENITTLVNAVKSVSMQVRSPGSPQEVFDGRDWLQFKKGIKAQSKLLNLNASEELQWLVSRLSPRVKAVWADVEDDKYYPCKLENTLAAFDEIFGDKKRFTLFDFAKMRQKSLEPVSEYVWRVEKRAKECGARDSEKLEFAYKGLQYKLKEQLSWRDRDSWESFVESIGKIERILIAQDGWVVRSIYEREEENSRNVSRKIEKQGDEQKDATVDQSLRHSKEYEGVLCYKCNKRGHIARNCAISTVAFLRESAGGLVQDGLLNGKNVKVLLDSGASVSCAKAQLFDSYFQSDLVLQGIGSCKPVGESTASLTVGDKEQKIYFQLLEDLPFDVLLGAKDFELFNVEITMGGSKIYTGSFHEDKLETRATALTNHVPKAIDKTGDLSENMNEMPFHTEHPELGQWISKAISELYFNNPFEPAKVKSAKIELKSKGMEDFKLRKPFKMEKYKEEIAQNMVSQLINHNILQPGNPKFLSPGFLVAKGSKNKYRLVVDFRNLNKATKDYHNYLCDTERIMQQVEGSEYLKPWIFKTVFFKWRFPRIVKIYVEYLFLLVTTNLKDLDKA